MTETDKAAFKTAFIETDYIIDDDPPLIMKVGERNDGLRALFASYGVESGAFITAWNPMGKTLTLDENYDRQAELLSQIENLRLNYFVGRGEHIANNWSEDSFLVLGISQLQADMLGVHFDQLAYLWLPNTGIPELRWCARD